MGEQGLGSQFQCLVAGVVSKEKVAGCLRPAGGDLSEGLEAADCIHPGFFGRGEEHR